MGDQILSKTLNEKFDTVFEEVVHSETLNLINKKLFHGRPHRCVLAITSSCI